MLFEVVKDRNSRNSKATYSAFLKLRKINFFNISKPPFFNISELHFSPFWNRKNLQLSTFPNSYLFIIFKPHFQTFEVDKNRSFEHSKTKFSAFLKWSKATIFSTCRSCNINKIHTNFNSSLKSIIFSSLSIFRT